MARRGDSIYLRGRTWRLDFRHQGKRTPSHLHTVIRQNERPTVRSR